MLVNIKENIYENISNALLHLFAVRLSSPLTKFLSLSLFLFLPLAGDLSKFGRGDASSPAPATTLAQPQQSQTQAHHTTQQPFLNPALPPGYSYTSLPYYPGVPGLANTFQYGPAMFPVSAESPLHLLASPTVLKRDQFANCVVLASVTFLKAT